MNLDACVAHHAFLNMNHEGGCGLAALKTKNHEGGPAPAQPETKNHEGGAGGGCFGLQPKTKNQYPDYM